MPVLLSDPLVDSTLPYPNIVPLPHRVKILGGQGDMPVQSFNTFWVTETPDSWYKLYKSAHEGGNGMCVGG